MNRFFHEKIEPSVQSLPVLRIVHTESRDGASVELSQTVKRNIYTEFDRLLSRNLAASGGDAFPAYTVVVEGFDDADAAGGLAGGFYESVPHALKEVAARVVERVGEGELAFYSSNLKSVPDPSSAQRRNIGEGEIDTMGYVLSVCNSLGDAEFVGIAGEFGLVTVKPPGSLDPILLHLNHGTVLVPSGTMPGSAPLKWPIFSFFDNSASNLEVQSYLAGVSQAVLAEKEEAIRIFRLAAEQRVVDFHRALAGRRLRGHWLESADALMARLKVGLGDSFIGISETARGIAFDLVDAMEGKVDEPEIALAEAVQRRPAEPELVDLEPVPAERVAAEPAPVPAVELQPVPVAQAEPEEPLEPLVDVIERRPRRKATSYQLTTHFLS